MIRHIWDDIVAADWALAKDEWAGVRTSTPMERKTAQAGSNDTCTTFVFRGCGYLLRLIVTSNVRQPSLLGRMTMQSRIRKAVAAQKAEIADAYSSSVFAAAVALVPTLREDIDRVRQSMRCVNCKCIMKQHGPIDRDSAQGQFVAKALGESDFAKRRAAQ